MARVKWGNRKDRRIEMGVSKGVLFPKGREGTVWNGLISVSENPTGGENVDLYADNTKYCSLRSAENYEATIEAYTYPEIFAECDGSAIITRGVEIRQQKRLPFDFCFRTEIVDADGNELHGGYKIHLVYNATASPSERSYTTINDSPEATTLSWDIKTVPFVAKGLKPSSKIVIDSTKADRIKVEAIEDILYGNDNTIPRMPDPDEVISLLSRLNLKQLFMNFISRSGRWVWDTFNFDRDTVPIAIDRESERHVFCDPAPGTEFLIPSIAYTLIDEMADHRKYMVIVIDDTDMSELASQLENELNMSRETVTRVDSLYYYQYYYYVYE